MRWQDIVYLDNSSTTMPCETAIVEMNNAARENWGNPSSLHIMGIAAEEVIDNTKAIAAKLLGCDTEEIFFTSGGTESNNLAIFGAVEALKRRGRRVVTTAVEHSSVKTVFDQLEKQGFEVVRLKPDRYGSISKEQLYDSITADTILVSVMLVNNEIGTVLPVESAAKAIADKNSPALLHCDAVQAFGKIGLNVRKLGADLISISGHKIHAPKGIGVLYKSKKCRIVPRIFGGNQQAGLRSGTEPVPLIAALGGAMREIEIEKSLSKVESLNRFAREKLINTGLVKINSPEDALPYILNVSVEGYRSETMLHFLETKNVFVSSGSACSKGKGSYVLTEIGLPAERVDSALRISFCRDNDFEHVELLCDAIVKASKVLRKR
ncbi:MAG: cysteine desulfurase family protein [bacterium]|nr:cysteine desulfurase family protein [bacterium]